MSDETPIDVEKIIFDIEQRIWTNREGQDSPWMADLDPELRAHLVRLRELAGGLKLDVPVTNQSSFPLLGPLLTWWRRKMHELVLFYLNSLVRHQVAFAQAVTRSVIYLAERYEAENKALRAEVEELRCKSARLREE